MVDILRDLAKGVVGIVVFTPAAIVADTVTLCGAFTERKEPYTSTAVRTALANLESAGTKILSLF